MREERGEVAGSQPMSTAVHRSPKKIWISNVIFNLWAPPYRMKGNALSSSTSGYAYVGGACVKNLRLRKISSVAIVEDRGGYSGVIVAAHELGKAAEHHENVQYKGIKIAVRKNGNVRGI
jgi:hypothetical protein